MKTLLATTALVEVATGLALLLSPSPVAVLFLGAPLDSPPELVAGRVAGAAVLLLGVACWLARGFGPGRAARGLVVATLLYDIAVIVVLTYAGVVLGLSSFFLWSAVVLHKVLAIWCIVCLWTAPVNAGELSLQSSNKREQP